MVRHQRRAAGRAAASVCYLVFLATFFIVYVLTEAGFMTLPVYDQVGAALLGAAALGVTFAIFKHQEQKRQRIGSHLPEEG